jgi:heme-degrading monooxygenase HmoA
MAVRILIKRKIPKDFEDPKFNKLIRQLRTLAVIQRGYVSGETLRRIGYPQDYLVMSTWQSIDAWDTWWVSPKRAEVQEQIDALLVCQRSTRCMSTCNQESPLATIRSNQERKMREKGG